MLFARLLYQSGGRVAKGVSAVLRTGPRRVATGAAIGALWGGISSDANTEDSVLRSMMGGALVGGAIGLGTTKTGWNMAKGLMGRAGRATGVPQQARGLMAARTTGRIAQEQLPKVARRFEEDSLMRVWALQREGRYTGISATAADRWAKARGRHMSQGFVESASAMARMPHENAAANSLLGLSMRTVSNSAGILASRPGLAMLGAGGVIGGLAMASPRRQPIGAEAVPFAQQTNLPGGGQGLDLAGPVLPPNRTVKRRMLKAMRRQEKINASRQQRGDDSMTMLQGSTYGMVQGMHGSRHRGG